MSYQVALNQPTQIRCQTNKSQTSKVLEANRLLALRRLNLLLEGTTIGYDCPNELTEAF
jgi:hypothetical protein